MKELKEEEGRSHVAQIFLTLSFWQFHPSPSKLEGFHLMSIFTRGSLLIYWDACGCITNGHMVVAAVHKFYYSPVATGIMENNSPMCSKLISIYVNWHIKKPVSMRSKTVPYYFECALPHFSATRWWWKEKMREIPAGSLRAINHELAMSVCFPARCKPPGLPVVCVLLLLLLLVLGLLQLIGTSARTGRLLTAYIISTDSRSQACNSNNSVCREIN